MKMRALANFKTKKLFSPCKKILQIFKFRLKKPLFVRGLGWLRRRQGEARRTGHRKRSLPPLLSLLLRRTRKMDRVMELKSFSISDAGHHQAPRPSPLTPFTPPRKKEGRDGEEVEDACRSFENYLVEMIVNEGRVRDLTDVEELLYCWRNLRCPVFIDLVCRFYGELCRDLFSNNGEDRN